MLPNLQMNRLISNHKSWHHRKAGRYKAAGVQQRSVYRQQQTSFESQYRGGPSPFNHKELEELSLLLAR